MSFETTSAFMLFAFVLVGNSPCKIQSNTLSNFTFIYPHDNVKLLLINLNQFESTSLSFELPDFGSNYLKCFIPNKNSEALVVSIFLY